MKLPKKRLKKMQHKLIMTWDIAEGKEQEYFDFLVHTFVPRMNQLGFDLAEAWATIYGDCPQIMVTALLPDELEAERRMSQNDWHVLIDQLEGFVDGLEMKLVPASDGFQY
jgi:hypothetical protein